MEAAALAKAIARTVVAALKMSCAHPGGGSAVPTPVEGIRASARTGSSRCSPAIDGRATALLPSSARAIVINASRAAITAAIEAASAPCCSGVHANPVTAVSILPRAAPASVATPTSSAHPSTRSGGLHRFGGSDDLDRRPRLVYRSESLGKPIMKLKRIKSSSESHSDIQPFSEPRPQLHNSPQRACADCERQRVGDQLLISSAPLRQSCRSVRPSLLPPYGAEAKTSSQRACSKSCYHRCRCR
jgi:hypothetical protein